MNKFFHAILAAVILLSTTTSFAAIKGAPFLPEADARFDAIEQVVPIASGDISVVAGVSAIGAGKVTEAMLLPMATGLNAHRVAKFVYDCSGVAGQCTVAPHGLGVALPAHALVTKAYFYTKTTVTSTSNDGTIAFHCKAANDLFSAADIDAGTGGQGVAGQIFTGVPTGSGITGAFQTDTSCEITATIAIHALTAGKIDGYVEYVIAE